MTIKSESGTVSISYVVEGNNYISVDIITYTKILWFKGCKFLYGKSSSYNFNTLWEVSTGLPTQSIGKNVSFEQAVIHLKEKTQEAEEEGRPLSAVVENMWNKNVLKLSLWEIGLYLP